MYKRRLQDEVKISYNMFVFRKYKVVSEGSKTVPNTLNI